MIRNRSVTAMRLVITRQGEACSHLACVSLGGPGEPEILAMLYVRGAGASAPLDYDDAVALRDWLSAWIVKQGRVDPPVELDEWKDLDPERLVMLTGPGDHSARELPDKACPCVGCRNGFAYCEVEDGISRD